MSTMDPKCYGRVHIFLCIKCLTDYFGKYTFLDQDSQWKVIFNNHCYTFWKTRDISMCVLMKKATFK